MVATQIFFIFIPKIGEDSHFDEYFSDGLKVTTDQKFCIVDEQEPGGLRKTVVPPAPPNRPHRRKAARGPNGLWHWNVGREAWLNSFKVMGVEDMGVSNNRGTPKSSILIGFSIINHPFWRTSIFGNTHMFSVRKLRSLFSLLRMVAWAIFCRSKILNYDTTWCGDDTTSHASVKQTTTYCTTKCKR